MVVLACGSNAFQQLATDDRVVLSDIACLDDAVSLEAASWSQAVTLEALGEAHLYASLDALLSSSASFLRLALPSNGALSTEIASSSHAVPAPTIQAVASGAAHFLLLTSPPSPQVFSYGDSRYGQSGPFASSPYTPSPADPPSTVSLNHLEHFDGLFPAEVACGAFHSAVRTRDGSVYVFGSNKEGQLGVLDAEVGGGGGEPELLELPDDAEDEGDEVRQVACGAHHTVVLQRSGRVWVAGLNDEGQLGLGDTESRHVFVRNHAAEQMARSRDLAVSRIVCSRSNTFFELSPSTKEQH
ncbi:hypothetical protein Rhopal_004039-T1 [Rhodotorula paludigena]|uniref:Regulator of chromosome condensation 1/beta-lactamase-inhibitor protein II n=1 Tax=Rhodotorula paludigena TaxID=86838 RepID=A0AAV5GER5_9BASI|nr:hypothetical protein Rhopal_004039-T1 [Rhodotorula paludigena]